MGICVNCVHKGTCGLVSYYEAQGEHIVKCGKKKPQTNADRIRSMDDEELAEWLADILNHCENKKPEELCHMSCPLYKCCNDQPSDNIEDWLKSPVEVEK